MTCVTDMLKWFKALIQASKFTAWVKGQGLQAIFPVTSSDHETLTPERPLKALVSYLL